MRRFVSVWLPAWPVERMRRAERLRIASGRALAHGAAASVLPDEAAPLALVASAGGGLVISAANPTALYKGVRAGMSLADARAVLPQLVTRPAEPEQDRTALLALARWAGRYGPSRNAEGVDGLWVDITGVAHLYGGEPGLLRDLLRRLHGFGHVPRIALADTPGAAFALARFASGMKQPVVRMPEGRVAEALAPLPVAALRLDADAVLLARRLGLKRIGQLYDLPRASLARRFRSHEDVEALLERLDMALGRRPEPRDTLVEPPELRVARSFAEPLVSADGVMAAIAELAGELCHRLAENGRGLRRGRLTIYRADASSAEIAFGLSAPARDSDHVLSLVAGKLEGFDAGFGIDLVTFEAVASEPLGETQPALAGQHAGEGMHVDADAPGDHADRASAADIARLIDRLSARLGRERVEVAMSFPSHRPERAEQRRPLLTVPGEDPRSSPGAASLARIAPAVARPPLLLTVPEPVSVVAEVPDGPPLRFTWRRVEHRVARAEGPERIAREWWLDLPRATSGGQDESEEGAAAALGVRVPAPPDNRTRDYYRVEDVEGGRYWLYRDGLYGQLEEEGAPRWFVHGLFG